MNPLNFRKVLCFKLGMLHMQDSKEKVCKNENSDCQAKTSASEIRDPTLMLAGNHSVHHRAYLVREHLDSLGVQGTVSHILAYSPVSH